MIAPVLTLKNHGVQWLVTWRTLSLIGLPCGLFAGGILALAGLEMSFHDFLNTLMSSVCHVQYYQDLKCTSTRINRFIDCTE